MNGELGGQRYDDGHHDDEQQAGWMTVSGPLMAFQVRGQPNRAVSRPGADGCR
jgi:hypothetical protein